MQTAVSAAAKRPVLLAEIETATGFLRVWTGLGDLTFDGDTYAGVGALASVSAPEETTDLKSTGLVFSMTGIPTSLLEQSVNAVRQNLPARLWLGFLDMGTGALIADPVLVFEGTCGVPSTEETGETCTIALSAENIMASLKRPREIRYTPEDQANRADGDKGFDYNALLQDKSIDWGSS
ncbi:MAG: hypothetical protein O9320_08870 [Magnetospirillum sp.]|nr:hypothetical protein [Magnetospirillum sp.]